MFVIARRMVATDVTAFDLLMGSAALSALLVVRFYFAGKAEVGWKGVTAFAMDGYQPDPELRGRNGAHGVAEPIFGFTERSKHFAACVARLG